MCVNGVSISGTCHWFFFRRSDILSQQSAFHSAFSTQIGRNDEITGIDVVSNSIGTTVVATASLDGVVKLWSIDLNSSMRCTSTIKLDANTSLKAVKFSADGGQVRAFHLFDGQM